MPCNQPLLQSLVTRLSHTSLTKTSCIGDRLAPGDAYTMLQHAAPHWKVAASNCPAVTAIMPVAIMPDSDMPSHDTGQEETHEAFYKSAV